MSYKTHIYEIEYHLQHSAQRITVGLPLGMNSAPDNLTQCELFAEFDRSAD
jgi:hypothetical protein